MKNWKIVALIVIITLIGLSFFVSSHRVVTDDGNINISPAPTQSDNSSEQQVTMEGTIICLPHKDTSGPVTLECAFGLQTDDGNYGLRMDPEQNNGLPIHDTGDSVEVTGIFIDVEDLESVDRARIYDIVGVIEVESIDVIED